jgi:hypothetical protein
VLKPRSTEGFQVRASCLKSGGDDDAAELGGHVGGGGLGLAGVPQGERAAFFQVGGVVAGGCVLSITWTTTEQYSENEFPFLWPAHRHAGAGNRRDLALYTGPPAGQ